jgi:hypothetical protein
MDKEDLNILNFFKDKRDGFYVDVGCFHPLIETIHIYYI